MKDCKRAWLPARVFLPFFTYFAELLCIRLYCECAKLCLDIKKEKRNFCFSSPKVFKGKLENCAMSSYNKWKHRNTTCNNVTLYHIQHNLTAIEYKLRITEEMGSIPRLKIDKSIIFTSKFRKEGKRRKILSMHI